MEKIDISVIIPVYNAEKYLNICLDSLLCQTKKDIEIICVNDGSNDASLDILNYYKANDNRVVVINQINSGTAIARNNGLKQAKGDYVFILDNDDFFEKTMLEKTYDRITDNNADICLFSFRNFDQSKQKVVSEHNGLNVDNIINEPFNLFSIKNNDIFSVTNPASWNKLYRRQFIINNKIEFKNKRANDLYFTFMSIALAKKIVTVREDLLTYRIGLSNNLEKRIKDFPMDYCDAFLNIKEELIKNNLYDIVRVSLQNRIIVQSIYNFRNILVDKDIYNYVVNEYKNKYINQFGLLDMKQKEIYEIKKYNELMDMLNGNYKKDNFIRKIIKKLF